MWSGMCLFLSPKWPNQYYQSNVYLKKEFHPINCVWIFQLSINTLHAVTADLFPGLPISAAGTHSLDLVKSHFSSATPPPNHRPLTHNLCEHHKHGASSERGYQMSREMSALLLCRFANVPRNLADIGDPHSPLPSSALDSSIHRTTLFNGNVSTGQHSANKCVDPTDTRIASIWESLRKYVYSVQNDNSSSFKSGYCCTMNNQKPMHTDNEKIKLFTMRVAWPPRRWNGKRKRRAQCFMNFSSPNSSTKEIDSKQIWLPFLILIIFGQRSGERDCLLIVSHC